MIKIAVYGTLRYGNGNHHVMGDSPKLGDCRINGFKMVSLGGFPAVDKGDGAITVEVYECDEHTEARCNMLEGYIPGSDDGFYGRKTIDTPFGEAEIYYMKGVLDDGYEPIPSGDWNDFRQARVAYG